MTIADSRPFGGGGSRFEAVAGLGGRFFYVRDGLTGQLIGPEFSAELASALVTFLEATPEAALDPARLDH